MKICRPTREKSLWWFLFLFSALGIGYAPLALGLGIFVHSWTLVFLGILNGVMGAVCANLWMNDPGNVFNFGGSSEKRS